MSVQDGSECAGLRFGDDEYVIYDRENHQAWVESDTTVADMEFETDGKRQDHTES